MADALAKEAKLCTRQQVWLDYIPADIAPLVSFDAHWGSFNKAQAVRFLPKKKKKEELRVSFENITVKNWWDLKMRFENMTNITVEQIIKKE